MSAIPAHCPHKAGDRVQRHGYSGDMPGWGQTGFRGVVETYIGGTILVGRTDDGREWAAEWGSLDPDLTPCHEGRCGCCPHTGGGMVDGRLIFGRCHPEQACVERARVAARWRWRPQPLHYELVELPGLDLPTGRAP